jgi:hypothetical protein
MEDGIEAHETIRKQNEDLQGSKSTFVTLLDKKL